MASSVVYMGTRISTSLSERLEAAAQRENNTVSAVVRRLLTIGLDREEKTRRPSGRRKAQRRIA